MTQPEISTHSLVIKYLSRTHRSLDPIFSTTKTVVDGGGGDKDDDDDYDYGYDFNYNDGDQRKKEYIECNLVNSPI